MIPAARIQAAIEILDAILDGQAAEQALTRWARSSRFAGSGDRAAVRDHVFDALRCRRSFAVLGGALTGRGLMLGAVRASGADPATLFTGARFAPAALSDAEINAPEPPQGTDALDLPDWLLPELERSLGAALGPVAEALRHRAPVHMRANARKATPDQAQAVLSEDGIDARRHPASANALEVTQGQRKLRHSRAYLDGLVELQDGASQAVVEHLPLTRGQKVLDFCAGGGGKSLAMAARADIALDAHDIAPERMADLPARAVRAGVVIRCCGPEDLHGPYDLVLCDAPCSGSGAWRRSPDGKWRLTPERLTDLMQIQDGVLDSAASYVGPQGKLAYVTCSLLACENQERIDAFLARTEGWIRTAEWHWLPGSGTDGFFLALLTRQSAPM